VCGVVRLVACLGVAVLLATAWTRGAGAHAAAPRPRWAHGFIVFKCADELCLLRPGTESGALLLDGPKGTPRPQWDPALSENGRYLAFRGYYRPFAEGNYALYVLNLRRGTRRRVTPRGSIAGDPSWSPDGRWIVFDTSGAGEIWKVRAGGGGRERLTRRHDGRDSSPAWSPNGRWIAFVRTVRGRGQIWVMRADGRDARLLHADTGFSDERPTWSHDGTRIAFSATHRNRSELETMTASGNSLLAVTTPQLDAWNPVWLPNDRGIAFLGSGKGSEAGNLFVMRPDGRDVHRLTHWHGSMRTEEFSWVGARYSWGRC
jgi:Tol biopolymer transport system component